MKKTMKKLTLGAERIRNLSNMELEKIAGGAYTNHVCPQTEYHRPTVCQTDCHASACYCRW